jgi:hypothetical protein
MGQVIALSYLINKKNNFLFGNGFMIACLPIHVADGTHKLQRSVGQWFYYRNNSLPAFGFKQNEEQQPNQRNVISPLQ